MRTMVLILGIAVILMAVSCLGKGESMEETVRTLGGLGAKMYLLKGSAGYALVDTGMKGSGKRFLRDLGELGVKPEEIRLIILTHSHIDHAGELPFIRRLTGAKVLCHRDGVPFIEQGTSAPTVPRNTLGKIMNAVFPGMKTEGTGVDIAVSEEFDLAPFGLAGKVIPTPGHSRDSLSIVLDSGDTLVGDQFRGKAGSLSAGMFYEDRPQLLESLKKTAGYNPAVLHLSHGTTTDLQDLKNLIERISREGDS